MKFDAQLLKDVRNRFIAEMSEQILALSQHLALLEDSVAHSDPEVARAGGEEAIKAIMRELHTLKGASSMMDLNEIGELCHGMETVISPYRAASDWPDNIKQGLAEPIDVLYQGIDWADKLLNQLRMNQPLEIAGLSDFIAKTSGNDKGLNPPKLVVEVEAVDVAKVKLASEVETVLPPPVRQPSPFPLLDNKPHSGLSTGFTSESSVRVSGAKLDELLGASTELLVARMRMRQHQEEIGSILSEVHSWSRQWKGVRASHARIVQQQSSPNPDKYASDLSQVLQFVEFKEQRLKQLENDLAKLLEDFTGNEAYLSSVTDQLQFETRRLRLIPLATLVEELERGMRQLARNLGKQVQLIVYGAELEVDKKLLDDLKASLIHLLRNALDHGVESPARRRDQGKPEIGTITLTFHQTGRSIEFEIKDDGAGINPERIREVAVQRGLICAEDAARLEAYNISQFIFQPGFSTRQEVTDISGRGVGLDAVKEMVTRLGGSIEVESWPQQGTQFHFSVPNLLFTSEGILVRVAGQTYILPVDGVERSFRLSEAKTQVIGSVQYLIYDGQQVAMIPLSQALGLPENPSQENSNQYVILLQSRGRYGAFTTDALLRNQEVVVKHFSQPLVRVRHFAGATILSDHKVVLILNSDDLIRTISSVRFNPNPLAVATAKTKAEDGAGSGTEKPQLHILVVDDSITTRTLEKNILEESGFLVQTARNGVEALNYLRSESYDLVISDVEMPEMDGFQLTARVKQDPNLSDIPVIIVSSLWSPEAKVRGMEAGAAAYIVKNRFDQQGLLATIRQLV